MIEYLEYLGGPWYLDGPWMEMFIGWQTYWMLLTNQTQNDLHIIKQCGSLDVLQVCVHLRVGSCKLPFIQVENVVITNSQASCVVSYAAVFVSIFTQREDKKSWVGDYFLPTTPPVPFKYGYSFARLKRTHYIGMELQKNWTSAKYEEPITLINGPQFRQLRSLIFV